MPNALPAIALCLVCLPIEAALLPYVAGWGGAIAAARVDLALCAVLWLAVGPAGVVEGALGAFACGALADLLYAVHPGLFTLLAMVLYTFARVAAEPLDVRGPAGFAALCGMATLVEAVLARGLLAVVGRPSPTAAWGGVVAGAALTAVAGAAAWRLLGWLSHALQREDPSLLR